MDLLANPYTTHALRVLRNFKTKWYTCGCHKHGEITKRITQLGHPVTSSDPADKGQQSVEAFLRLTALWETRQTNTTATTARLSFQYPEASSPPNSPCEPSPIGSVDMVLIPVRKRIAIIRLQTIGHCESPSAAAQRFFFGGVPACTELRSKPPACSARQVSSTSWALSCPCAAIWPWVSKPFWDASLG